MRGLGWLFIGCVCWLTVAQAHSLTRAEFLIAVKTIAAEEGVLTEDAKLGILDESLYEFGQVVCQARQKHIPTTEILNWMAHAISNCTPRDLLLSTMAAADLYLCPS